MTSEQIAKMKEAMETIGKICGQATAWAECDDCPFDGFCTAINDAYCGHDWHDMEQTFCTKMNEHEVRRIILEKGGFREKDLLFHPYHLKIGHTWNDEHKVIDVVSDWVEDDGHENFCSVDVVTGRICG